MLKKYVALIACVIGCMLSLSIPVRAEGETWIKLVGTVPENFNLEVFASVKNKESGKVYNTTIRTSSEYIGYLTVEPGEYVIQSVTVDPEYEAYFDAGFSTQTITVTAESAEPATASFFVGIAGETDSSEVGSAEKENVKEPDTDSSVNEDSESVSVDEEKNEKSTGEALSEEEYIASVKEKQEKKEAEKRVEERNEKRNHDWLGSIGVTCFALIGLGVGYWYLKKKRDL